MSGGPSAADFPPDEIPDAIVLALPDPDRLRPALPDSVADPGPDREWPGNADPRHGVRALALDKARRIANRRPDCLVVGADTVVVGRGRRFGKLSCTQGARWGSRAWSSRRLSDSTC